MCVECTGIKICEKCYKKSWYLKNKDRICNKQKQRRRDNPEHFKKLDNRKYRKKHPNIYVSERKWSDPEFVKEYRKKWYQKNKDIVIKKQKEYLTNNPDKKLQYRLKKKEWESKNLDNIKKSKSKYKKSELGKLSSKISCNKRRAKKLQAQPIWVDENEIKKIYENCPEGLEVDHIIPLQGKNVSGLHVPWNLQYLTPEENQKKSNKLILPLF